MLYTIVQQIKCTDFVRYINLDSSQQHEIQQKQEVAERLIYDIIYIKFQYMQNNILYFQRIYSQAVKIMKREWKF